MQVTKKRWKRRGLLPARRLGGYGW